MESISNDNFGPLIAYLVPGATALAGFSPFSLTLRTWFAANPADSPSLGGFLYLTVASLATGMTVSAVRWALVDTLHARTGLPQPPLDFFRLRGNVEAFSLLIDIHYRHYLFYANMFVATAAAYASYRLWAGQDQFGWPDVLITFIEAVFFAASRDTLKKYYMRSTQLLRSPRGRKANNPTK